MQVHGALSQPLCALLQFARFGAMRGVWGWVGMMVQGWGRGLGVRATIGPVSRAVTGASLQRSMCQAWRHNIARLGRHAGMVS